jgi:hypothetical protein
LQVLFRYGSRHSNVVIMRDAPKGASFLEVATKFKDFDTNVFIRKTDYDRKIRIGLELDTAIVNDRSRV